MVNRMFLTFISLLVCVAAIGAIDDPGIPDTVWADETQIDPGQQAVIPIYFYNDEQLSSFSVPMSWNSPDILLDSFSYVDGRADFIAWKPNSIDTLGQKAIFGAIAVGEGFIEPGTGMAVTVYINIPSGIADQVVDFVFPDEGDLIFSTADGQAFIPQGKAWRLIIGEPPIPPALDLVPDSMHFEGTIGYPDPPSQVLTVKNDGDGELYWTCTATEPWIITSPSSGSAPSVISIRPDINGLTEGVYVDTVIVTSDDADNSPQYLVVVLDLIKLPPIIEYDPVSFFISAVQGGANPDDEVLEIWSDVPGSDLNWTISNSESWLSPSPASGSSGESTILSFDITGLAYGIHYDTVVISDPNAENDPQKVPVTLQVVSDLPILSFSYDTVIAVVPLETTSDSVSVLIYNNGEGSLTYTASESTNRISSLSPASGTAPQVMTIYVSPFKLDVGDYLDSILVTSPEAVNSPRYLYVLTRVSENPATLVVFPNQLTFTYYECWQGPDYVGQMNSFQVLNTSGSGDMEWSLEYNSEWMTVSPESGINTADKIMISATLVEEVTDLMELGTYYDTITVYAPYARNSPKEIEVRLDIIPGVETPELVVGNTSVSLTAQEVFGPRVNPFVLDAVYNNYPGCMDYTIEEDIDWLNPLVTEGDAPAQIWAGIDGGLIEYGIYNDSFFVNSATASNIPIKVDIELKVWRLHGDNNWDNSLNIVDVHYLLLYLFFGGPGPQPAMWVGDVNCDALVNITDAHFLVNWLFFGGDEPCGNP